jgi:hypothetical protein
MKVYEVLKRGLLLAILAGVGTAIALLTWKAVAIATAIETEVGQVGARAERQIAIQGDRTRDLIRTMTADLAVRMERQVAGLRDNLQQESAAFRQVADVRLAAIQQDAREQIVGFRQVAEKQLGDANASMAKLASFGDVQPDVKAILGDFAKTSSLMFDCKAAPRTCVAPRFAGTFRAVELAAGDFSKTMKLGPQLVGTAQKTNEHIERYVDRFTKPKSIGAQIKDVGLTLAGFGWKVATHD